ncbi:restriction endonuclease [Achromobacter xylosoxidans]|uniref:nSTAND3 domain-containing NTPase n=1 Tax=Alcaligenes xylosoxydans xylosoxydans TaxID=85698 RepID=UPI0022B8AF9F|nr:restriction endonuclease [Achromobacter xylosoxidans]MCZ8393592.1 restriction endonuclease [Achromobacter xylosoxidans]
MPDYDFKTLNDKEFEALCTDLLSRFLARRFERFKPGKDAGVDGRYFGDDGLEVILQCKHWANTPTAQLIAALERDEKPKLDRLKPNRYILAISNPLSRADKKKISDALKPYIIREDDIYGKEDLNDLLSKFPEAERNSYKLWLHSASVLAFIAQSGIMGRSEFSLGEIIQKSARYAVTENHKKALDISNRLGVLIISGDPGVGKTTLAEHLCLQYVSEGFQFVNVIEDIKEAEQIFSKDTKQIFYFDDFLGRNYLEAIRGHEGGHLAGFMRRVSANKIKRFILTSRSTILNQGKFLIDAFENENLKRNECEVRIEALSLIDKARILYNHIWHSGLSDEFREEFYTDKRYRKVISHNNFNPRLINFITDPSRRESDDVAGYWPYIERSLTDPSMIWGHPFDVQLDASQRAIVLLVVLNRRRIHEMVLANAFHRLADRPGNQNLRGRHDFGSHIRLLTGSFLSRIFYGGSEVALDLFNPSIGDFLLRRYAGDIRMLKEAAISLRSVNGVETILNIKRENLISENVANEICRDILVEASREGFSEYDVSFISILCNEVLLFDSSNEYLTAALKFVLAKGAIGVSDRSLSTVRYGFTLEKISVSDTIQFLANNLEDILEEEDILDAIAIANELPDGMPERASLVTDIFEHVVQIASDSLSDFVEITDALSGVCWEDAEQAEYNIVKLVQQKFEELGLIIAVHRAREVARSIDIEDHLRNYIMNSGDADGPDPSPRLSPGPDEVDDLFDRG